MVPEGKHPSRQGNMATARCKKSDGHIFIHTWEADRQNREQKEAADVPKPVPVTYLLQQGSDS